MIPLDTEKTESGCLECKKKDNKKANDKAGGFTMKKQVKKRFWSYVVSAVLCLTIFSPSLYAAGNLLPSASEVFPEEEVEQLKREIEQSLGISFGDEMDDEMTPLGNKPRRRYRPYNFPTRKGLILVTDDAYKDLIPTGHAGIIYGNYMVVESLILGVEQQSDYYWWGFKKNIYAVSVDRTTVKGDERAADWCYNQLRKPYNFNYQNIYRRDAFYCSQLIHAAFWDLYRIDLNTSLFGQAVHPLELMNNGQVSLVYQLKD